MTELRYFVDMIRDRFVVPYPLADRQPFVSGRGLVLQAQDEARLDPEVCLVATVRGQLLLTPAAESFGIAPNDVRWALAYETSARAA